VLLATFPPFSGHAIASLCPRPYTPNPMKTLSLVRHAKSSWKDPTLADRDRPLNKRGKRDAPRMGKRLARTGTRPDLLISSPAVRAWTTAETIAAEIGYPIDRIKVEERIYLGGTSALMAMIRDLDDSLDHVMMFGHNPDVTELVNALTGSDLQNVPTCGIAHIELASDSWSDLGDAGTSLLEFDYPKRVDD
jgi:phosphohistidine phosphatase